MKKKVQITIEHCNVFYIKQLLDHVKGFLRSHDYIVVEEYDEAAYSVGVFCFETKFNKNEPLYIQYIFEEFEGKERTLTYNVKKL